MYKKNLASKILSFVDFTSLNDKSNHLANIAYLCDLIIKNKVSVASICIYSEFIVAIKEHLENLALNIPITTVCNFPYGNQNTKTVIADINKAIDLGADEIDVVMPYYKLKEYKLSEIQQFLKQVRATSINHVLKVIIETGEIQDEKLIRLACNLCLNSGADFIKTSTGKVAIGATLNDVQVILTELYNNKSYSCGLKISGGVTTVSQAEAYIAVAEAIMGTNFLSPQKLRIGSSSLVKNLLEIKQL